jgi:hypothetical protein
VYILRARRDQLVKLQGTSGTISTNQFDNLPLLSSPIDLPSRFLFMVHFLFFLFFGGRERKAACSRREEEGIRGASSPDVHSMQRLPRMHVLQLTTTASIALIGLLLHAHIIATVRSGMTDTP